MNTLTAVTGIASLTAQERELISLFRGASADGKADALVMVAACASVQPAARPPLTLAYSATGTACR